MIVVEAKHIASGQTQNTTAKITSQHGLFYDKLIQNIGIRNAKAYAEANEMAIHAYVLALKKSKKLTGMYYSIDENGLSLRSAGENLLLGGGSHRTGKKSKCANGITGYAFLRKMARAYYPDAVEITKWSAQDCMPHDDIPFIGNYSIKRPYWYVVTGFKKWGMTSSMIAAMIISEKICSGSDLSKDVFSPQRCFVRASVKNLMIDVRESIMGLGKGIFSKKERRCPHMGCKLEWNEEENELL